jgi:hypothetical protein
MQGLLFSCETVAPSARRSHSCTCDAWLITWHCSFAQGYHEACVSSALCWTESSRGYMYFCLVIHRFAVFSLFHPYNSPPKPIVSLRLWYWVRSGGVETAVWKTCTLAPVSKYNRTIPVQCVREPLRHVTTYNCCAFSHRTWPYRLVYTILSKEIFTFAHRKMYKLF